jgi:hypothetical protein
MNNNNASIADNQHDTNPFSQRRTRREFSVLSNPMGLRSEQTTNSINTYLLQQGQGVIDRGLHGEQAY